MEVHLHCCNGPTLTSTSQFNCTNPSGWEDGIVRKRGQASGRHPANTALFLALSQPFLTLVSTPFLFLLAPFHAPTVFVPHQIWCAINGLWCYIVCCHWYWGFGSCSIEVGSPISMDTWPASYLASPRCPPFFPIPHFFQSIHLFHSKAGEWIVAAMGIHQAKKGKHLVHCLECLGELIFMIYISWWIQVFLAHKFFLKKNVCTALFFSDSQLSEPITLSASLYKSGERTNYFLQ